MSDDSDPVRPSRSNIKMFRITFRCGPHSVVNLLHLMSRYCETLARVRYGTPLAPRFPRRPFSTAFPDITGTHRIPSVYPCCTIKHPRTHTAWTCRYSTGPRHLCWTSATYLSIYSRRRTSSGLNLLKTLRCKISQIAAESFRPGMQSPASILSLHIIQMTRS